MNRKFMILGMVLIVLLIAGQAYSMTVRAEASRNDTTLTDILVGIPFNIDVYMNNDDSVASNPLDGKRLTFSMPFAFHDNGTSIGAVTLVDSGGTTELNALEKNGIDGYFDLNWFVTSWSWDGTMPDSINFTGIGFNAGWPYDLGEQLYLRFTFQVDNPGEFCIDSIGGRTAVYDWLLDPPSPHFNGGTYCWDVVTGSAVASEDKNDLLPKEFDLSQNYPNPFNPTTIIDYALPTKSDVSLSIYNILGQKITTLINGEKPAGYHSTVWNGTTANGSPAASGIYFYKIEAGEFARTKKLMLLK